MGPVARDVQTDLYCTTVAVSKLAQALTSRLTADLPVETYARNVRTIASRAMRILANRVFKEHCFRSQGLVHQHVRRGSTKM